MNEIVIFSLRAMLLTIRHCGSGTDIGAETITRAQSYIDALVHSDVITTEQWLVVARLIENASDAYYKFDLSNPAARHPFGGAFSRAGGHDA